MKGTGTQADPYIPENVKELRTALSKTGAYVECEKDTVYDLDDESITSVILISCSYFNGNDCVILNLDSSVNNLFLIGQNTTIENVILKDFSFSGGSFVYINNTNKQTFNNIVLIGEISSGILLNSNNSNSLNYGLYFDNYAVKVFNNCGFYIDYSGASRFNNGYVWFIQCYLYFSGNSSQSSTNFFSNADFHLYTLFDGDYPTTDQYLSFNSIDANGQNVYNINSKGYASRRITKTISGSTYDIFPSTPDLRSSFINTDKSPKGMGETSAITPSSTIDTMGYITGPYHFTSDNKQFQTWHKFKSFGGDINA